MKVVPISKNQLGLSEYSLYLKMRHPRSGNPYPLLTFELSHPFTRKWGKCMFTKAEMTSTHSRHSPSYLYSDPLAPIPSKKQRRSNFKLITGSIPTHIKGL